MSNIAQFAAYAAAFEKAYESDDWSEVAAYFSEDAVYVVGLDFLREQPCEGRDAVLAHFKDVLDGFDRCFASRELTLLEGPIEDGDSVWIRGSATYTAPGAPDFVLELKETVKFRDGQICHLEDAYSPEMTAASRDYLAAHGKTIGLRL